MDARTLSSGLSVSAQITVDDIPKAAALGIRTIICNRPDSEEPDQPRFADIAEAAEAHGLQARYLPVVPGQIGETEVTHFGQCLDDMPGPVLAYCRTGTRSAMLWALAMATKKSLTDILAATQAAGCDVNALIPRLAARVTPSAAPVRG